MRPEGLRNKGWVMDKKAAAKCDAFRFASARARGGTFVYGQRAFGSGDGRASRSGAYEINRQMQRNNF